MRFPFADSFLNSDRSGCTILTKLSKVFYSIQYPPIISQVGRKSKNIAGVAQLVEHNLAKVGVAGSNPVARSIKQSKQ
jgi:hypothetical protein